MPEDLDGIIRRAKQLQESSKHLCDGSARAIQKSKRLIEAITASRNAADGELRTIALRTWYSGAVRRANDAQARPAPADPTNARTP